MAILKNEVNESVVIGASPRVLRVTNSPAMPLNKLFDKGCRLNLERKP